MQEKQSVSFTAIDIWKDNLYFLKRVCVSKANKTLLMTFDIGECSSLEMRTSLANSFRQINLNRLHLLLFADIYLADRRHHDQDFQVRRIARTLNVISFMIKRKLKRRKFAVVYISSKKYYFRELNDHCNRKDLSGPPTHDILIRGTKCYDAI